MINWLREAVTDSRTNKVSAKRVAMLLATASLAIATDLLALAAIYGRDVGIAIGAVAVPLAGLGGFSYVQGKANELKHATSRPE